MPRLLKISPYTDALTRAPDSVCFRLPLAGLWLVRDCTIQ